MDPNRRLIALGASNLTRGLPTVVRTAEAIWGRPLEIFGALGHGRSYGMTSSILRRALPGILQSGIWDALASRNGMPSTALVTDIGNDVAYGADVDTILAWIEDCVARLQAMGADVAMTDLPVSSLARLGPVRFSVFRSLLVPSCQLPLHEVQSRASELARGLETLAASRSARLFRLRDDWYGVDPIHIRPRQWAQAWSEILAFAAGVATRPALSRTNPVEWLRYYLARPQQESFFGLQRRQSQPALTLSSATTLSLF